MRKLPAKTNTELSLATGTLHGDLLVVAAMLFWAIYTVIARPLLKRFTPLELTALSTIYGTLPLLVWGIPSFFAQSWGKVDMAGWGGILFSGLFSIAICYVIWNEAVLKVGPSRTAIFSNLIPVFAVITGVIFLNEPFTFVHFIGSACVIGGILLTRG